MGGIIVALLGIALIVGAFLVRKSAGKSVEENLVKMGDLKVELRNANNYDRATVSHKIDRLKADTTALRWVRRATWVGVALGLILIFLTVFVQVPTRNIAVTDAFGRPTNTLGNGPHLTAPWESPTIYDASVQTLEMSEDGSDGRPAQRVRIINGTAVATMNVTVEWQIDPNADIQKLHQERRNFDAIQDKVVKTRLSVSLNSVFETYDPLVALREANGQPVSLSSMEGKVKDSLQAAMPAGIIIHRVMLPFVQYPPQVQKSLDDMSQELAATQIAMQQKLTATEQKAAIDILAAAKMSPEVFGQQCLIVTERLAQQGKPISYAWTCVAGSNPFGLAVTGK